ncbi:MAG: peptide chain release factor N(5)-glutamine methyltransferase [Candidatus Nanopelagicales bacterium]
MPTLPLGWQASEPSARVSPVVDDAAAPGLLVSEVLKRASTRLELAGVASPRVDAELLLVHVTGVQRSRLPILVTLTTEQLSDFDALLDRRCTREPLQHLTGEAYFRHLVLQVGPGVFIPRPETETLVDLALVELAALGARDASSPLVVVDLCTGSAAIPLAIATELTHVRATGVELSAEAFEWATRNVGAHSSELTAARSSLTLINGDAREAAALLHDLAGAVDLLTCNPPYIPAEAIPRDPEVRDFDPAIALYGGPDGLDVVRDVVEQAVTLLRPGGLLLLEHGDEQGEGGGTAGFPELARAAGGFTDVVDATDLAGRPRVTAARRKR